MWGTRLKSFNTVVLLLSVAMLAAMWFTLPHIAVAIVFGIMLLLVPVVMSMRDSISQTDMANMAARGITPEYMRYINSIDGSGLRREMAGAGLGTVNRRLARHPAFIIGSPATDGGRRVREPEPLGPGATVTLVEERRAAGIDDLFEKLDRELIGLVPVKK